MPIQGPNDMFPEGSRATGPYGGARAGTRRTDTFGRSGTIGDDASDVGDGFDGDWERDDARGDEYGYGYDDDRYGDDVDGFERSGTFSDGDIGGFGAFRHGGYSARGFVGRGSRRREDRFRSPGRRVG